MRASLLRYFGEGGGANAAAPACCGACDDTRAGRVAVGVELRAEAALVLRAVNETGGRFGAAMVIDVLRGSRSKKVLERFGSRVQRGALPSFGAAKTSANYGSAPVTFWRALYGMLIAAKFLVLNDPKSKFRTYRVSASGRALLLPNKYDASMALVLVPTKQMQCELERRRGSECGKRSGGETTRSAAAGAWTSTRSGAGGVRLETKAHSRGGSGTASGTAASSLSPPSSLHRAAAEPVAVARLPALSAAQQGLMNALNKVIEKIATARGVASYMVLGNAACRAIATVRPTRNDRLLRVEGVTAAFVRRHGDSICSAVAKHCAAQRPPLACDLPRLGVLCKRLKAPPPLGVNGTAVHSLHAQGMACTRTCYFLSLIATRLSENELTDPGV